MNKKLIISIITLAIVILLLGFIGYGYIQKHNFKLENPIVTMEIQDYGTVKIELDPNNAPNTVINFIKLINDGYYDGMDFTRISKEYGLVQTGDGAALDYTIEGEFEINDYKDNKLSFERGTIGLARQDLTMYAYYFGDSSYLKKGYDSGNSAFFIMTEDFKDFDGSYCAFGKVIEGLEIIDKLMDLETKVETTTNEETGEEIQNPTETPVNPPIIKSMTVDTFGINYGEPKKIMIDSAL